jgi:hypothetical protein
MANTAAVITDVTKETMRLFENNLVFTSKVNRQFDDSFGNSGRKIGSTLTIRLPSKFTVRSGATFAAQDVVDNTTVLTQGTQKGVDIAFTSQELFQSFDMVSDRYIKPMVETLCATIDKEGMALYSDIPQLVGTPGTTPSTMQTMLDGRAKILNAGFSGEDMHFVGDIAANNKLIVGQSALFNNQGKIGDQYTKGVFGRGVFGLDTLSWSQSTNSHVAGLQGGTPTVNGAAQTGATVVTQAWSNSITGAVVVGDVVTFAGCFEVNTLTKATLSNLKQFVVTAIGSTSGAGAMTIAISPSIVTSGASQNVSASPTNGGAVTVMSGTTGQTSVSNLMFAKDTFAFVMADLDLPTGGVIAAKRMRYKDFSIRLINFYDGSSDQFRFRLDVLYGWKTVRPEWGCRIAG